eukprot:CAMPEP_0175693374 /NCGR_PEP_ID=MMETSP0097-20121207/31393_1 /TAXON_ID=311494 /ORGANISM="Alexandrium monilatum, Strain CCMP3105" /LENGTH=131 /DNA_ID=CAMNT_0017000479 /DNA_START=28 /DNA_END=420 /DNA_ORIENTATION=-
MMLSAGGGGGAAWQQGCASPCLTSGRLQPFDRVLLTGVAADCTQTLPVASSPAMHAGSPAEATPRAASLRWPPRGTYFAMWPDSSCQSAGRRVPRSGPGTDTPAWAGGAAGAPRSRPLAPDPEPPGAPAVW